MKTTSPINLYHIAYSPETLANVPEGFAVLNNVKSERNDWREYWPIRNFLLSEKLSEDAYYGFLSPRFFEKTGLDHKRVCAFVESVGADVDVVSFSPQVDMSAFFLNVFEQEELFQPGFTAASEAFFASIDMPVNFAQLITDSRQTIFSNYFVAKPSFWRAWLSINEKLFAICEGDDSPVKAMLTFATVYPGAVERKVFLMERIATLLLALESKWRVKSYNPFTLAWSASRLNQFKVEAVISDALKIAMREQGFGEYMNAFSVTRDKLR